MRQFQDYILPPHLTAPEVRFQFNNPTRESAVDPLTHWVLRFEVVL